MRLIRVAHPILLSPSPRPILTSLLRRPDRLGKHSVATCPLSNLAQLMSKKAPHHFSALYTRRRKPLSTRRIPSCHFSTATGYVHLVRHLSPDIVYVQESLTGKQGDAVQHISGWVRQVVVVVGDEGGRGGLIDSEDESVLAEKGEKWWQKEGMTGIGKRIDVVDVHRTGEDWRRRVSGHD